jgi:hypothetical protein
VEGIITKCTGPLSSPFVAHPPIVFSSACVHVVDGLPSWPTRLARAPKGGSERALLPSHGRGALSQLPRRSDNDRHPHVGHVPDARRQQEPARDRVWVERVQGSADCDHPGDARARAAWTAAALRRRPARPRPGRSREAR